MKNLFFACVPLSAGLAALGIMSISLPVQAKSDRTFNTIITPSEELQWLESEQTVLALENNELTFHHARLDEFTERPQLVSQRTSDLSAVKSASVLQAQSLTESGADQPGAEATPARADSTLVAQDIDLGQDTRSGPSYIGIAGNIGLTGDTSALGDTSFTVISKIGLLNTISFRPAVAINEEATFLLPITFDFRLRNAGDTGYNFAPYLGAGVAITTGSAGDIGPLITGGIDFPLSPEWTATAAVNVGFLDETNVGLLIGIGYNFNFNF